MRVEPCVCGGFVAAPPADPRAIFRAVIRHNRTPGHRAWREENEA